MPELRVTTPSAPPALEALVRDYLASCRGRGLAPSMVNQAYAYSHLTAPDAYDAVIKLLVSE